MKNLLWVILAAVVIGGGYYLYSENARETAAIEAAEEAAARKAADEAEAAAAKQAEEEAAKAAEAARQAEEEAAKAAEEEAARAAAEEEARKAAELGEMLTPEGFDLDGVIKAIDESSMDAVQKTTLKAAVQQAKDNPDALKDVLGRLRDALGL